MKNITKMQFHTFSPLNQKIMTKEERSLFSLSDDLKAILVGLLLGDLYARKQKRNVNARLCFEQGLVHETYLFHLYDLFKSYCQSAPKTASRLPDKRTGKIYSRVTFTTCALPCFNELYDLFYPEGKKVIPKNICDLLSPLGLAYWICDDGTFASKNNSVILCTNSYLESEVDSLIAVLSNNFGLNCCKYKHMTGFRIVINKSSLVKLQGLVRSHVHSTMLYKIGL